MFIPILALFFLAVYVPATSPREGRSLQNDTAVNGYIQCVSSSRNSTSVLAFIPGVVLLAASRS